MEIISTTNPVPSSGTTSTVPLSLEGTATASIKQNNILKLYYEPDILQKFSYHGKFTINSTQSRGTSVFTWDFKHVFKEDSQLQWVSGTGGTTVYRPRLDYNFIRLFFARMSKCNFFIRFLPVKVADCRVGLNVLFDYNQNTTTIKPVNSTTMSNDNLYIQFDDPEKEHFIIIPAFWLVNYIPNTLGISPTGKEYVTSPFMPTTRMNVAISSQYQPSLIQPDSFDVIVEFGITEKEISGYSANTAYTYYAPGAVTSEPRPWVFNTVNNVIPANE